MSKPDASRTATAPKPPDEAKLTEIAAGHLARYGTTRAGLSRILERHVARWASLASTIDPEQAAEAARAAREAIPGVVARLAEIGAVDDAGFAATRARRLTQEGRSRRAVVAHLRARGVEEGTVESALSPGTDDELAAAVATTRRRRIGAYRRAPVDAVGQRKELATLARAGFPQDIAQAALRLDLETAEALIARLRRL